MATTRVPADWPALPDDHLLDLRMADLPLTIEGSKLAERIARLRAELSARDLYSDLHFYLADEWFTPDGTSSIAIPFYLAHPRLEELEETQMLEVEGGEYEWCMRILRHESGHAIDNAYRLSLKFGMGDAVLDKVTRVARSDSDPGNGTSADVLAQGAVTTPTGRRGR